MANYYRTKTSSTSKRITLKDLKEQSHVLNMQMLLAIQTHNKEIQEEIQKQMTELQTQIDHMCLGRG